MHRRIATWVFFVLLLASGCAKQTGLNKDAALAKVRSAPSSLPGLSVEQAVEQVLADMNGGVQIKRGRWYSNPAIEHEGKVDAYKVGFEFTQGGKASRFGWIYYYDDGKLEPLTDFARQVTP